MIFVGLIFKYIIDFHVYKFSLWLHLAPITLRTWLPNHIYIQTYLTLITKAEIHVYVYLYLK